MRSAGPDGAADTSWTRSAPFQIASARTPASVNIPSLWRELGPGSILDGQIGVTNSAREVSGRVTAVKVHPTDPRVWVIGTSAGGIWWSKDGGATWKASPIHPALGTVQVSLAIGAIALGRQKLAYAGIGNSSPASFGIFSNTQSTMGTGLLTSDDIENGWRPVTAKLSTTQEIFDWQNVVISGLLIAGDNPGKHEVWVATRSSADDKASSRFIGLFFAHATGLDVLTFTPVLEGPISDIQPGVWHDSRQGAMPGSPVTGGCIYAGGTSYLAHGKLQPATVHRVCPHERGPVCVGQYGPATAIDNVKIAVANGHTVYASLTGGVEAVLVRTDNVHECSLDQCKTTWNPIAFDVVARRFDESGFPPPPIYCNWNPSGTPHASADSFYCRYSNVLSADPHDPDILYAGGVALWKCIGCRAFAAIAWRDISYTTPRASEPIASGSLLGGPRPASPRYGIHVDQQAVDWSGQRLVVANDGGVWSTVDRGATWENHNFGGLAISQIFRGALDPRRADVLFAGTQDTGTIRRDGRRWRFLQGGDGVGVAVSHKDPATHWLTVHQSSLVRGQGDNRLAAWRTRDGGLTYQRADLGIDMKTAQWLPPLAQCPHRSSDVVLFGARSLWKVRDLLFTPTTRAFETASPPMWQANYQRPTEPGDKTDITAIAFAPDPNERDPHRACQTYAFADTRGVVRLTKMGGGYDAATKQWKFEQIGAFDAKRTISAMAFASHPRTSLYVAFSTSRRQTKAWPGYIYRAVHPVLGSDRSLGVPQTMSDSDTWIDVSPRFKDDEVIDQAYNVVAVVDAGKEAREIVLAGSDFGVWMSPDGDRGDGKLRWCRVAVDPVTPYPSVLDLKVHPVTGWVYVFTFGRGVFRLKDVKGTVAACRKELASAHAAP